jgi:carbonic anhydrase
VLPAGRTYYGCERSLTTPPWSETVDRFGLAGKLEVAEADIARW